MALLLLCLAYVVPGFFGRDPWRNADITAFGHMFEMARGNTSWLAPTLLGQPPEFDALLPYWLGAWAMQLAPPWVAPDVAARFPFILLLGLTLAATWYAVYSLARSPRAQPVSFAFGGEASPTEYARAIADGGLLALVACLGLAQFSHETTPSLAQVAFTAISFYGMAALPVRPAVAVPSLFAGLAGLALSGAPSMAVLFGAGGVLTSVLDGDAPAETFPKARSNGAMLVAAGLLFSAGLSWTMGLWHWRIDGELVRNWRSLGRLLLWFTWPAWPLALWTLWRWRRQLRSRHVALPLWFALVALVTTWITPSPDRSLLLALPALAALAAFALPTLSRTVAALIDWFTLLFFSGCAVVIWVIWISLQTGIPAKPAANVAKLAPGFEPSFSMLAFVSAFAATIAWAWLVRWRTGRHRVAIWKSLVLPASGAALYWFQHFNSCPAHRAVRVGISQVGRCILEFALVCPAPVCGDRQHNVARPALDNRRTHVAHHRHCRGQQHERQPQPECAVSDAGRLAPPWRLCCVLAGQLERQDEGRAGKQALQRRIDHGLRCHLSSQLGTSRAACSQKPPATMLTNGNIAMPEPCSSGPMILLSTSSATGDATAPTSAAKPQCLNRGHSGLPINSRAIEHAISPPTPAPSRMPIHSTSNSAAAPTAVAPSSVTSVTFVVAGSAIAASQNPPGRQRPGRCRGRPQAPACTGLAR